MTRHTIHAGDRMTVINETRRVSRRKRATTKRRMTEEQFVAWAMAQEDVRVEWVDGEVVQMAPVSGEHSDLSLWLLHVVDLYVRERNLGLVRGTEFMTRFREP